ncbi:hypothetical protein [Streptomyces sp. NBC_01614]|uniref:hypothetical protein n=1 Tax=Streptomyces sp. NBC_01614 TaxID=2975897 RepID=UPI00386EF87C
MTEYPWDFELDDGSWIDADDASPGRQTQQAGVPTPVPGAQSLFVQSATSEEQLWKALNALGAVEVWTGQGVSEELGSDALRVLRDVADSYGITAAGSEDLASLVVAHLAAAAAGPPPDNAYAVPPTTAPAPYTSAGIGDDRQLLQWCIDSGYARSSYDQVRAGVMAQWQFGAQEIDGWLLRLAARFGLSTVGVDADGLWQAIVTSSTPAAGQPHPATAPPPATGHTATTTVSPNQAQDGDRDQSDDTVVLWCVGEPQMQALTFDALAAHLAQWDFSLERVQHSLARIAYSPNVSLQGLDWEQAWQAIVASERALSGAGQGTPGPVPAAAPAPDLEAMVDACLARRLPLDTALADISGRAHVQQIDVADYIIALARHRLGRTYTDPDTAYYDLQRTVPQPTRKRRRDDYEPWLLSAALSTDNSRKIAQQAGPHGAPTTDRGIDRAISSLGGKLGLQGTTQEIRQQLQAMQHNGTLQNPDLYIPVPAPQPAAQHMQDTLDRLTPMRRWLLSAALSTDNFRKIAQQAAPVGAPTAESGIKKAICGLGGKLGLQGTAQEIRQQLQAMQHNGTLQNPDLYIPAPAPQPAAQHMQDTLDRLTPMRRWLLSAALSTDNSRKIAQQAEPVGAPPTDKGIEKAICALGGKLGLQGTTQEIRQQLQAMQHRGALQNPDLYIPAPAPQPAAQDVQGALDRLTQVQWWLLGAALSHDTLQNIADTAARTENGAPKGRVGIQTAIVRLGDKLGLAGTARQIREQLRQLEAQGVFRDPGTYR